MATRSLTAAAARRARLASQLLGGSDLSPTDVVARAGALQGQDLPAVLRAIAIRSRPGTTVGEVRAAFDRGDLVRSWPMRGTLFVTTPGTLAGILASTSARLLRSTATRRATLGLDETVVDRALGIAEEKLDERPRTRAEMVEAWTQGGIDATAGRGYHLLMHTAVLGRAHWGAFAPAPDGSPGETEQLFTRTPEPARPGAVGDPAAALTGVIGSYVRARGPVTEADLAWWTKLPLGILRPAVAAARDIETVEVDGTTAWVVPDDGAISRPNRPRVLLAPAFDEIVLGYQDRSLLASPAMQEALVPGNNGVFRPVVLLDGRVVGTWRAGTGRQGPSFELVEDVPARAVALIDRALASWPHRAR